MRRSEAGTARTPLKMRKATGGERAISAPWAIDGAGAATSALAVEGLTTLTRSGEKGARSVVVSYTVIAEGFAANPDLTASASARRLGDDAVAASPDVAPGASARELDAGAARPRPPGTPPSPPVSLCSKPST